MALDASEDKYHVVIYTKQQDPHDLSLVFQEVLKLHPTDATIWARHVPGLLNEILTLGQAQTLVSAIGAIGQQAEAIPCAAVPDLHQARAVHHARCEESGLQILDLHGAPETLIPWPEIQMLCVGEVPRENSKHYPTTIGSGLSAGHYYKRTEFNVPQTHSLELWLTCSAPTPILFIEHDQMNYEYLGTRRVDSSTVNFHQFVEDLQTRSTNALLPESTQAYLKHDHPEHFRFKNADDFSRYATLNALLARKSGQPTV